MDQQCRQFAQQLRSYVRQLAADKFTLYINDPWWPGEMRLYDYAGLEYPEPMLGFLEEDHVKRRVIGGSDREFWEDSQTAVALREEPAGDLDDLAARLSTRPCTGTSSAVSGSGRPPGS
jgi:hypothetical protein